MASEIPFCLLILMIFLGIHQAQDSNFSMQALHQEWMTLHGKNYSHLDEHRLRFKIFEENVNYINTFNAKSNQSYKLGINKFTDLTNREFREIYASGHKPKASNQQKPFATQDPMSSGPDNWDWVEQRAVTPVKDQGTCGSCWAFSAVAAVETLLWLKINHRLVNLSEQVILNCGVAFSSSGCTGDQFSVAFDVVQQIGIPSDEFFPYLGGSKGSCDLKTIAAVGYKIGGYTEIQGSPRERAVLDVVRNQPVSVSINGGTHNFQHYKGDIFDDPSCSASPEDQNHGVTIVGFGTSNNGKKYWKVKNSWGKTWGEDGYMRIARDQGRCGIATEAYYPNGPI